jgi:hypothetical protein
LLRHAIDNATWVETGTHTGSTTKLLSENFPSVHTIEPSQQYFKLAQLNLKNLKNIIFHNGPSEDKFEPICKSLTGNICFWLDGHFCGSGTFQGTQDTPIKYELKIISKYIHTFNNVVVLIDDIRLSYTDKSNYPPLEFYVNWAKTNNLLWTIEHDIFIIKSSQLTI